MDPLSTAPTIIAIIEVALEIASALIKYAREAKHVPERRVLAEEATSLSRLLEGLRKRARESPHHEAWLNDHKDVVCQFEDAYHDLVLTLKYDVAAETINEGYRLRAARTAATWSFTKTEIYSLLERVARMQQYAILLLSGDPQ